MRNFLYLFALFVFIVTSCTAPSPLAKSMVTIIEEKDSKATVEINIDESKLPEMLQSNIFYYSFEAKKDNIDLPYIHSVFENRRVEITTASGGEFDIVITVYDTDGKLLATASTKVYVGSGKSREVLLILKEVTVEVLERNDSVNFKIV